MATNELRTQDRDSLARFLGWFSIGLGTAQVAMPKALTRLIGADAKGKAPRVMRLMGVRELAHGTAILTQPRPTAGVWSRVGGDALDIVLLTKVLAEGKGRKRTMFAMVQVAPIVVADIYEARYLSRQQGEPQRGKRIRKVVTIAKTRQEVEEAWTAATELREKVDGQGAQVSFLEAPGDRGTELAVEFVHEPAAGEFGAVFEQLTGRDLATQLADDLRRFKMQVETGEIIRSDSTPDGHLLANHLKQRAAQPLEEEVPA
jgi:hypothetical protein